MCEHLCEGPALTFQAALGRQGHTRPRRRTVEHDAAVCFTDSTTGEQEHTLLDALFLIWCTGIRCLTLGCTDPIFGSNIQPILTPKSGLDISSLARSKEPVYSF